MKLIRKLLRGITALFMPLALGHAAGTLTPTGSAQTPIQIRTHQVNVTLNNGFAQTEVLQTFFNPNAQDLEAIYAFPVPKSASLSEVTIVTGEKTLNGEVLPKSEAEKIYQEERASGNDAGLAQKNSFLTYEFKVTPVPANAEVSLRFVYYQPLEIDAGVGRYVYPLEDGGTDEVAQHFWTANPKVEGALAIKVELKSTWPIADVRVPGFETVAVTERLTEGHYKVGLDQPGASLARDFVFYYRLADNLPGRVEVIPYRASKDKPGTFMMVVTPGIDLKPLTNGADYSYVLDVSGSMRGKIHMLANGVAQALGQMSPNDRFRVVTFNNSAREIIPWTSASPENAQNAIALVKSLTTNGGTDLYDGVRLGLKNLDADRATSVVLVTDGVANRGIIKPAEFHKLIKQYDVRVFGFLMGNSANWPLMRAVADASGGFYAGVSNADDIVGQLILARGKITHEALHNASFTFDGVRVFDTTGDTPQKIYRGQQLVIFGKYEGAGKTTVTLKASLTGEDKTYTTTLELPEIDTDNPEIERLWAMSMIEQIEMHEAAGFLPPEESHDAIQYLGASYQLVTDYTSMVVLDDDTHARRGIARNNQQRIAAEHAAQSVRAAQPARQARVDTAQPAFNAPAPHVGRYGNGSGGGGGGGGDVSGDVVFLGFMVALLIAGAWFGRCQTRSRN